MVGRSGKKKNHKDIIRESVVQFFDLHKHDLDEVYEWAAKDFMEIKPEEECRYNVSQMISSKVEEFHPEISTIVRSKGFYPDEELITEEILQVLWRVASQSVENTANAMKACFIRLEKYPSYIREDGSIATRFTEVQRKYIRPPKGMGKCPWCGDTFNSEDLIPTVGLLHLPARYGKHRVCRKCYDERATRLGYVVGQSEQFERILKYDEALRDCVLNRTCGILTAHKKGLDFDDERIRSAFLVNLVCGIDGARKYLQVRGDFSVDQLKWMTDGDIMDYINVEGRGEE